MNVTRFAGLLVAVVAASAPAQATFFPPGDFTLNAGAERSQVLATGETLGHGQFRVALVSHALFTATDGFTSNLTQLREHLAVAVGLTRRFQLSAQAPLLLVQDPKPLSVVSVGRPWVSARVALLFASYDEPGVPWLALDAAFGVPGLGAQELDPRAGAEAIGSAKVSVGFPWAHDGLIGLEFGGWASVSRVDLTGGVTFVSAGIHLKGELTVRGDVWLGRPRGFVEALGGIRYVLRPIELSLLTGPGYGLSTQGFDYRLLGGISFLSPEADDGLELHEARADCTDGTNYPVDRCPELDFDNDGVLNGVDRCPREFGPRQNDGCPWPDSDGDGIEDRFDSCPRTPGPMANAGCPKEQKQLVVMHADKLEILERVFFEFDQAVIKPESYALLGQVALVITSHPELKVRIEGHTDQVGTAEYNRTLSKARARAVKTWLVSQGQVAEGRLTVAGFGFDQPIDGNDTDAGRARNRRVEFMFVTGTDPVGEP